MFEAMVREQAADLTAGRECYRTAWDIPKGVRPSIALVRNAHQGIDPGEGNIGVVRVVDFQEGWDGVQTGEVVWVGSCR